MSTSSPHLGSLLGKASRPLRSVMLLWSLLAAATYWGTPRISVRDAFATAYNDNGFLQALIGLAVGFGALQVLMQLLPSLRAVVLSAVSGLLPRRLRALPLYTRRQLKGVLRLVALVGVFFWVLSKVRGGRTGQLISAGLSQLPLQLPAWLFQGALTLGIVAGQFLLLFFVLSRGGIATFLPEEIKTNFSMVWGQDAVLEKVKEVVTYLKSPEIIESRGGHVPGGVLLWGPPGTGKTLIAEAVAGETATPFVLVEPAAFQNMFVGIGPLKVRNLYKKLRKLSEVYGGVVVFFDEADVLGSRSRGQADNGLRSNPEEVGPERLKVMAMGGDLGILNAILANMQGVRTPKGFFNRVRRSLGLPVSPPPKYRILHMMATNMPNSLDPALLRPGRIDRIFRVGYPSREGRIRTFQGYLAKVRHNLSDEQVAELAVMTTNATGAVIKDIVNEALISSLREGREEITWVDFLNAKRLKEFGPPEGVEYVPFERHAVAVHEACHAFAAWKLRNHLTIDTVTIEKGQDYLGMVASRPTEDLFTRWRSEYRIDIAVALSSLAGERLFFDGDSTSGVAGDLDQATRLAALMTGRWGMGESIASRNALIDSGMSEDVLDSPRRVEDLLREVFEEVSHMIATDRQLVLALAHALEHLKTLAGPDVVALFERRPGLFLDGRVYAGEAAARILEEYHDELKTSRRTGTETRTPAQVAELLRSRFTPGEWPTLLDPATPSPATAPTDDAAPGTEQPEAQHPASEATSWGEWPTPDPDPGQLDNPDRG